MVLAMGLHARREEPKAIGFNAILFIVGSSVRPAGSHLQQHRHRRRLTAQPRDASRSRPTTSAASGRPAKVTATDEFGRRQQLTQHARRGTSAVGTRWKEP
jgi:hypothetical protein